MRTKINQATSEALSHRDNDSFALNTQTAPYVNPDIIESIKSKIGTPITQELDIDYHGTLVIEYMSQGHGICSLPNKLGVSLTTIKQWAENDEAFYNVLQLGIDLERAYWLDLGLKNVANTKFNTSLYTLNMNNKFNWSSSKTNVINDLATREKKAIDTSNLSPKELATLNTLLGKATKAIE